MHDLGQYTVEELQGRYTALVGDLATVGPSRVPQCDCDDFEVDDGYVVRECPWNDIYALDAELIRRPEVS